MVNTSQASVKEQLIHWKHNTGGIFNCFKNFERQFSTHRSNYNHFPPKNQLWRWIEIALKVLMLWQVSLPSWVCRRWLVLVPYSVTPDRTREIGIATVRSARWRRDQWRVSSIVCPRAPIHPHSRHLGKDNLRPIHTKWKRTWKRQNIKNYRNRSK